MDSHDTGRADLVRPITITMVLSLLIVGGLTAYRGGTVAGAPTSGGGGDPNSLSAGARKGKQIFDKVGCLGCHTVHDQGGKVGPNLSNVGNAGHSRQWLKAQIRDPKSHDPQTAMPALDNLSNRQVNRLVDYLESLSTAGAAESRPSQEKTSASSSTGAKRGRQLFVKLGCIACHKVHGQGGTVGPGLSDVGAEGYSRDWFKTQIRHPREHDIHSVMPAFDYVSDTDVNDLVDYLETLTPSGSTSISAPKGLSEEAKAGKEVFDKVGCLGCHMVHGQGGNIGPNLSEEGTKGNSRQWLTTQIRDPKSHDPQTAMPAFDHLSDQQVSHLVDYLESLGTKSGSSRQAPSTSLSEGAKKGKQLFDKIGCLGCHMVHGQGGDVGPDLSDEGAKGRSRQWLTTQILNPRAHKPETAMPAWDNLTDQQVGYLVDYLESLGAGAKESTTTTSSGSSQPSSSSGQSSEPNTPAQSSRSSSTGRGLSALAEQGRQLFHSQACITCHTVDGRGGQIGPNLTDEGTKGRSRQWLTQQIRDPKSHHATTVMPAFKQLSDQQVKALVAHLESLGAGPSVSPSTR